MRGKNPKKGGACASGLRTRRVRTMAQPFQKLSATRQAAAKAIAPPAVSAPPSVTHPPSRPASRRSPSPAPPQPGTTTRPPKVPRTLDEALQLARAANRGLITSCYTEHAYWIDEIEGELPQGLCGTLLKNGPGLFEIGGQKLAQPYDGDGMVCSISLDGQGRAFFTNKFVRTPAFMSERRTGMPYQRTVFNKRPPSASVRVDLPLLGPVHVTNPWDFTVKDVANTSVIHWGGRTLAMYERGVPYLLADDLTTLGATDLGGTMRSRFMAAHTRTVQEADGSERLVMFSTDDELPNDVRATVYEYDEAFKLLHRTQVIIPGGAFGFYHDIAVTENYYVLVQNRNTVDMARLFTKAAVGAASLAECMQFQPQLPTRVHLIPRPGRGNLLSGVRTVEVSGPSMFTLHVVNAFELSEQGGETGPGQLGRYLVMDSLSSRFGDFAFEGGYEVAAFYGDVSRRTEPRRTVIDLQAGDTRHIKMVPRFSEMPCVAPHMVGRPHTHMYCVGASTIGGNFFGPHQGILKLSVPPLAGVLHHPFNRDWVTQQYWQPENSLQFTSEPTFVPRAPAGAAGQVAEDDGWLMLMVYDAESHRSQMVILDAQDLAAGPVARLHLPHHVPTGFHGVWTPRYMGPPPGTPNRPVFDIRQLAINP